MSGSDGNWHETLQHEGPPAGSSDKSFGILFACVFGLIALAGFWGRKPSAPWWLAAALATLSVAQFAHPLLGPLNRGWRRFSLLYSSSSEPRALVGVMYIRGHHAGGPADAVVGKDSLRLRLDPEADTYWILREGASRNRPRSPGDSSGQLV